jgi:hypothetical protein
VGKVLRTLIALAAGLAMAPAHPAGPWRADAGNTRGWQFMTPEERLAHQAKIRAFDSYSACRTYQADHHRAMDERAKQQGRVLAPEQRDACAHLQPPTAAR